MKATRKDIEFYQENMDRLQTEKAAETARANAMTNELSLLRKQHGEDVVRFKELMAEMEKDLPDIPYVFISSVTGSGIMELKDMLWRVLNEE